MQPGPLLLYAIEAVFPHRGQTPAETHVRNFGLTGATSWRLTQHPSCDWVLALAQLLLYCCVRCKIVLNSCEGLHTVHNVPYWRLLHVLTKFQAWFEFQVLFLAVVPLKT